MATGFTTSLSDYSRVTNSRMATGSYSRIADGGWEAVPSAPPKPLDVSSDETFEGWVTCGDGRTLWEYASGAPR